MFEGKRRLAVAWSLSILSSSHFRHAPPDRFISSSTCRIKLRWSDWAVFHIGNRWWAISRLPRRKCNMYPHNEELNCSRTWRISSSLNSKSVVVDGNVNTICDFSILRKQVLRTNMETPELHSFLQLKIDGQYESSEHDFARSHITDSIHWTIPSII